MIKIHVNVHSALAALSDLRDRQGAYLVSLTLNRVSLDGQEAERERIKGAFKLRRESFTMKGVYIGKEDRATKTKPSVTIRVEPKRSYLEKFEEGGEKVPIGGRKYLAIPDPAVFRERVIKPDNPLRTKNLHLHKDEHGRIIGDQRSFVMQLKNGQQAIMQRTTRQLMVNGRRGGLGSLTLDNLAVGMGPHLKREKKRVSRTAGTRRLYQLVRSVRVNARLEFASTVRAEVSAKLQQRFDEALAEVLATARMR